MLDQFFEFRGRRVFFARQIEHVAKISQIVKLSGPVIPHGKQICAQPRYVVAFLSPILCRDHLIHLTAGLQHLDAVRIRHRRGLAFQRIKLIC